MWLAMISTDVDSWIKKKTYPYDKYTMECYYENERSALDDGDTSFPNGGPKDPAEDINVWDWQAPRAKGKGIRVEGDGEDVESADNKSSDGNEQPERDFAKESWGEADDFWQAAETVKSPNRKERRKADWVEKERRKAERKKAARAEKELRKAAASAFSVVGETEPTADSVGEMGGGVTDNAPAAETPKPVIQEERRMTGGRLWPGGHESELNNLLEDAAAHGDGSEMVFGLRSGKVRDIAMSDWKGRRRRGW